MQPRASSCTVVKMLETSVTLNLGLSQMLETSVTLYLGLSQMFIPRNTAVVRARIGLKRASQVKLSMHKMTKLLTHSESDAAVECESDLPANVDCHHR